MYFNSKKLHGVIERTQQNCEKDNEKPKLIVYITTCNALDQEATALNKKRTIMSYAHLRNKKEKYGDYIILNTVIKRNMKKPALEFL